MDFNSELEVKKPWKPLSPKEVSEILKEAKVKWWIAGGYAIEEFVGEAFRNHEDIDILVLRKDLPAIITALANWDIYPSDPPGTLRPLGKDRELAYPVHDLWLRWDNNSPWAIQIMLNDSDGDDFLYKRDHSIRFNIDQFTNIGSNQIPFVAPEFQLLHKAKSIRAKDQIDFEKCLALLSKKQIAWLVEHIEICYSATHSWLPELQRQTS